MPSTRIEKRKNLNMTLEEIKTKYENQFKLKGYSANTLYSYWWHTAQFFEYSKPQHPSSLSSQSVNDYLVHISGKSDSFRNQAINGIKFYFDYILNRKMKAYLVIRPKKAKTEPIILSEQEVQSLFNACTNLKHKSILALLYSAGLRRSEVSALKITDIDSKNMVIWVRQGKGKRDRKALLNSDVLNLLRQYFKEFKPKEWLFNGQIFKHESQDTIKPYSEQSIYLIVKRYGLAGGIKKRIYPHLLRHGYCTGILDNGGDIHDVSVTAGHSSLKTSMGYIHSSTRYIASINSPISRINL